MQAESPENQTPVALSPNAMAQRDMNAMPAHVPPVSVGKKTFDARYAREIFRVNGSRTHRVGGDPRVVALSRIPPSPRPRERADASRPDAPVPSRHRRFRSPTDSNMSPASKFVNQKKKGSKLANGCVARPASPDPRARIRATRFRMTPAVVSRYETPGVFVVLVFHCPGSPTLQPVSRRRCMPSQLENNFSRAAFSSTTGSRPAPPSRFAPR